MELWNDYEGRIIADAYPLTKLLSPEGRSAFFSTTNGTGTPAIVRLIEPHFDEPEILERWRKVVELQQPNLITLRKFGQTELDGTALVYAVMEASDANLGEILVDRPLTVPETREVATSLVAALQALHGHNLVHEHVEPANIFATGEVIKLRSDCVREIPEGAEGAALKARDVHDLALVLLKCLTLKTTPPSSVQAAPFDEIIRKGVAGTWTLTQIQSALTLPTAPASARSGGGQSGQPGAGTPNPSPASTSPASAAQASGAGAQSVRSIAQSSRSASSPAGVPSSLPVAASPSAAAPGRRAQASVPATPSAPNTAPNSGPVLFESPAPASQGSGSGGRVDPASSRASSDLEQPSIGAFVRPATARDRLVTPIEPLPSGRRGLWIGAVAVGILLLLILLWHNLHTTSATPAPGTSTSASSSVASPSPISRAAPASTPKPIPSAADSRPLTAGGVVTAPHDAVPRALDSRANWRVVAYTFNRQDQAEKRAALIATKHSSLRPEVFTPTGHAPYLVTLGGTMSRDEASALKRKARASGLPRDTYAQNYKH